MTLSPAETAREVADIIDFKNERFDIDVFQEERECGIVGCIAGHTALLHGDRYEESVFGSQSHGYWLFRQGLRLGLTSLAARRLFYSANRTRWLGENALGNDRRYSLVLRQLEKELADRSADDLIDETELDRIITDALS